MQDKFLPPPRKGKICSKSWNAKLHLRIQTDGNPDKVATESKKQKKACQENESNQGLFMKLKPGGEAAGEGSCRQVANLLAVERKNAR